VASVPIEQRSTVFIRRQETLQRVDIRKRCSADLIPPPYHDALPLTLVIENAKLNCQNGNVTFLCSRKSFSLPSNALFFWPLPILRRRFDRCRSDHLRLFSAFDSPISRRSVLNVNVAKRSNRGSSQYGASEVIDNSGQEIENVMSHQAITQNEPQGSPIEGSSDEEARIRALISKK
jgi:hypothetical protein